MPRSLPPLSPARRPVRAVLLLVGGCLFLAACSMVGMAVSDLRCARTAEVLDRAFSVARAGPAAERIEVQVETAPGRTEVVVRTDHGAELLRERLDSHAVLALPAQPGPFFLDGRVQEEARPWICMSTVTGSTWTIHPEGGFEGDSALPDPLAGLLAR